MTINYISALVQPQFAGVTIWLFEISQTNYLYILTNPNTLNVNYNGTIINVNNDLYPNATVPPYTALWNAFEGSTPGHYYISFIKTLDVPYFDDITKWLNFNGPYTPGVTAVTNSITIVSKPQKFTPVYNPVPFTFYSPNYAKDGFRYLVTVTQNPNYSILTDQTIGTFKVVPRPDGSGYIDIQKILSNFTSVDFNKDLPVNGNVFNSYINYSVLFGEEYTANYPYTHLTKNTIAGSYSGYTVLNQTNTSLINPYSVGNQIDVVTVTTGNTATINGLHTVVQVIDNHTFVIDAIFPITSASTISVSGSTHYADNKKQGYLNLSASTGHTSFNGALDWFEYQNWTGDSYTIKVDASTDQVKLLTSIPISANIIEDDNNIYLTPRQNLWLNYHLDSPNTTLLLQWYHLDSNNNTINNSDDYLFASTDGDVKQFQIGWDYLGLTPNVGDSLKFRLVDAISQPLTRNYIIYVDLRCAIEEYEVQFMDRMGSILSIPFYLRATEKITITRDSNKQQQYYYQNIDTNLSNRGTNINNVSVQKTIELNTNWLNQGMLNLYEEMMSSPYTWLRVNKYNEATGTYDTNYHSCTIEDKDYEVTKQKNKRLIKKTAIIKLANDRPINI